ncbi:MAG: hypothetical protein NVSMB39_4820 [Candidatus Saccharimonadales bacterium]
MKTLSARQRQHHQHTIFRRLILIGAFALSILLIPGLGAHAATLSSASVSVADPRPNASASNYTFTGSSVTTGTIKCIKLMFTDTATGSTVPSGMSTTGAGVTFDTAGSNYMPTPASWAMAQPVNGTLQITNATGEIPASAVARKVSINGITNASTPDTKYYLKFSTYNNTDCTSSPVDNITVLFILTYGTTLSMNVDPTLTFTVNAVAAGQNCNGATATAASTATTVPFGNITTVSNGVVCQDLTAATNATGGYTIYARYTAAPTNSLAQTIASTSGTNAAPAAFSAPGTEAYGYTTTDTTLGTGTPGRFTSNVWAAMTTANAEVAYEPSGVNSSTYRIGHQVGVSLTTRPGTYVTTIIYTCTPVY